MQVYRIGKEKYIQDLSGTGAKLYGGRWNRVGRPVLYTSASRALAMLEVLVHADRQFLPGDLVLATLQIEAEVHVSDASLIPAGWAEPLNRAIAQQYAEELFTQIQHTVFGFPSVVMPEETNYIILPERLEHEIQLIDQRPLQWDLRF